MGTFGDEEFDSLEDIRERLISYHDIDYTGEIPLKDYTLNDILDYGEWSIEEVQS